MTQQQRAHKPAKKSGRLLTAIFGTSMLGLAACASPAPPPADSYYRLNATTTAAQSTEIYFDTLLVDLPRAQGMVTERPILYVDPDHPNQVQQYAYHYWESAPPQIIHRALITGLRNAGVASSVVSPDVRSRYSAELSGRLFKFERVVTDNGALARLQIELILENLETQEIMWIEDFTLTAPASDPDLASTIDAFNVALTDLVNSVTTKIHATN